MPKEVKVTQEQVLAAIARLMKSHGPRWMISNLADELGVSTHTVQNYRRRWRAVDLALRETKERRDDWAESKLYALVDEGQIAAVIFYAKTQLKHRGYVERQEITGPDGDSLAVTIIEAVAPHDTDPGPA